MSNSRPACYTPLSHPHYPNSDLPFRTHSSPTRKLHRFLSVSKLPQTQTQPLTQERRNNRRQDMVWNDNSSDKSWQFADSNDLQGCYSPSSPNLPSNSTSPSPPGNKYQPYSPTGASYAPSISRDSAYAPIPLSSNTSQRLSMSSGPQRLSLNPWKAKKQLKEIQEEQQQLAAETARREAQQREEKRRFEDKIKAQNEEHQAAIKRERQRQAEVNAAFEHEQRLRRQQEAEARVREAEMRAREEEAKRRKEALAAENYRRHQIQKERETKRKAEQLRRLKMNTPDALKGLRELIRQRYELDMEIWRLRDVMAADRDMVEEKMERADALLDEILAIVAHWDEPRPGSNGGSFGVNGVAADGDAATWTAAEWVLARDIKERLTGGDKRRWLESPPWDEDGVVEIDDYGDFDYEDFND